MLDIEKEIEGKTLEELRANIGNEDVIFPHQYAPFFLKWFHEKCRIYDELDEIEEKKKALDEKKKTLEDELDAILRL